MTEAPAHAGQTAHTELSADLRTIARRARTTLRERRALRAAAEALDGAALLAGVPALLEISARLIGGFRLFAPGWLEASMILAPVAWICARAARRAALPIADPAALAAVDRSLGLGDRLIAAREFLLLGSPTPFQAAAIDDARGAAAIALERGLPAAARPRVGATPLLRALGAILLSVAALAIGIPPARPAAPSSPLDSPAALSLAERSPERGEDADRPPTAPPAAESPARAEERRSAADEPGAERSGELTDLAKETLGRTAAGRSAAAASASGTSQSRGIPSNSMQSGESAVERAAAAAKKPKESDPPAEEPPAPREPEEPSGATAGRGAASGSGKSPSASKWSSKDQVTSEDEEDLEADEPVDDEFDDSEARGGVQPQLRDRKPPVNRDLTIGFGNQKNPDANGRGGPSEQKKSRGVASLVLGVPIPDHIKGRPNPGRTKVTQERVEPEEESAPEVASEPREPRRSPVGKVASPDLEPWLRDLVREYFRTMRERGTEHGTEEER